MEDAYLIKGGKKLVGEVKLSGAKNVALKTIIAALLFDGSVVIENVPRINDIFELIHLIKQLGGKADFNKKGSVVIEGGFLKKNRVDLLHASKIRVSFMFFAPLLYRFKECYIPNPGGCRLGARPIDRTIEGMKKIGIKVDYDSLSGYYHAIMAKKPSGSYLFEKSSHTGTELLILLSVFAEKKVIIDNCALEPEVDELINFLNQGGAKIEKKGAKIVIYGVNNLRQKKPFKIISDRNEAVTFAVMGLASQGNVTVGPIAERYLKVFLEKIKLAGAGVKKINEYYWTFYYSTPLKAIDIETQPHPGFMTDWQPPWSVLMTQAKGNSILVERIFENRFAYVEELKKLGVKIDYFDNYVNNPKEFYYFNFEEKKKNKQAIKIFGEQTIHGGVLNISDLRAGATLVIASLIAQGDSVIYGASILERGYEDFAQKINKLGGQIKKV